MADLPKKILGKRAPDGVYEIPLLGDVGYFGFRGEDLIRELIYVKPAKVRFTIYSPGGAVYDAIAVVGFMQANGIESFTEIYGYCASAATVFAAHSGPKNTAIAPGSMFLVHMPFHEDGNDDEGAKKAIENAVDFLIALYVSAYGWTKAEARKYMEANDGNGIPWTAAECKKLGIASEIMEGAKVAARLNINPAAMADTKKTIKVQAKVSLGTLDAIRASLGEGATYEVEVPVEEETAKVIADAEARIADLEKENADLKAKAEGADTANAATATAQAEAVQAKADLDAKVKAHADELAKINADHAAKVKALEARIPAAKPTIANNQEGTIAASPNSDENPNVLALRSVLAAASPLTKSKPKA